MTVTPLLAADGSMIPVADLDVLRRLAARKAQIAEDPVNRERRDMWLRHDAGTGGRPMVLAEIGGVRDVAQAVVDADLRCEHSWSQALERALRTQIYQFDVLQDDHVIEPRQCVGWQVQTSNYGVEVVQHRPDFDGPLEPGAGMHRSRIYLTIWICCAPAPSVSIGRPPSPRSRDSRPPSVTSSTSRSVAVSGGPWA